MPKYPAIPAIHTHRFQSTPFEARICNLSSEYLYKCFLLLVHNTCFCQEAWLYQMCHKKTLLSAFQWYVHFCSDIAEKPIYPSSFSSQGCQLVPFSQSCRLSSSMHMDFYGICSLTQQVIALLRSICQSQLGYCCAAWCYGGVN